MSYFAVAAGLHFRRTQTATGRRPRTWAQSTRKGDIALASEVAAVRDLLSRLDRT